MDVFPFQSAGGNREEEVIERKLFAHCKKAEPESEGLVEDRKKMALVLTRHHSSEGEENW